MQLPVVHLNGSSKKNLQEDYYNAYKAVRNAQETLRAVDCHPRDYYVAGDNAYNDARNLRQEQLRKLQDVVEYLEEHVMHLS